MAFDEPPKPIRMCSPEFSGQCRQENELIITEVTIDETGRVADVTIILAPVSDECVQTAIAAIEQFLFEPARSDGEPVSCRIAVPMRTR